MNKNDLQSVARADKAVAAVAAERGLDELALRAQRHADRAVRKILEGEAEKDA